MEYIDTGYYDEIMKAKIYPKIVYYYLKKQILFKEYWNVETQTENLKICEKAIDKLRDTSNSHQRCSIVEVMGRYCGDIAYAAALATGADLVITSETGFDLNEVIDTVKRCQGHKSRHVLIVITEHVTDVMELAKKIKEYTGFDARATILGHIQRGGSPSPFDRVLATRLGIAAVDELIKGNGGVCMGIFKNEVVATPIEEALTMKKQMFKGYKEMTKRVS